MNDPSFIQIPILTRVEGEAALHIQIKENEIQSLELRIYEPPRFFEKLLEKQNTQSLLDIIARICGLCPVAYQMTAVQAIESCIGLSVTPWIQAMRRVFYCGEWLQNHILHIHMLALPDYLGYVSAIEMAKEHGDIVKRGLRLQRLGNKLISLLGARSVHPIGVCVGGFFSAPTKKQVKSLLPELHQGLNEAEALLRWLATLELPGSHQEFTCVALHHAREYPMFSGEIYSDTGLKIQKKNFENDFIEKQVPYSNALHCYLKTQSYLVGPLSRINLNYQRLPHFIKKIIKECGLVFPSKNMFHSLYARAIESLLALSEAIRILEKYEYSAPSVTPDHINSGVAYGCSEAPRGLLWHRYELDERGLIKSAKIIPPTSQNQARIEEDLQYSLTKSGLSRPEHELKKQSEMIIRNYDPCISCSTHFLNFKVTQ